MQRLLTSFKIFVTFYAVFVFLFQRFNQRDAMLAQYTLWPLQLTIMILLEHSGGLEG